MEMKLGYTDVSGQKGAVLWPVYLCFIIFGLLVPFSKPEMQTSTFLLSVLLSLIIGLLAVNLLIMIFNNSNPALREQSGGGFAREAVAAGMLFMIPFTVLAVLAQLLLGWNAVMPFAAASMMTSGATAGAEVMKRGAQGVKNVIIPSILVFLLSTGWMLLIGLLP